MRRAVEAHLRSHHVSRIIYGATIGLALVVALQDHPPSASVVAGTLVGTALAVGLAELYGDVLGSEARSRRIGMARDELSQVLGAVTATCAGTAFPALFFMLAAVGVLQLGTAFDLAKWSGLGLLSLYGFCAARLAGAGLPMSLVHASAAGAIGGILIAIKSLLH